MTSTTWSPAHKALTLPAAPSGIARAWHGFVSVYSEINEATVEVFGSLGLQLGASDDLDRALPGALQRDIGRDM